MKLDTGPRKTMKTRKHYVDLKVKKDPRVPSYNLEYIFFSALKIKEKKGSGIQTEENKNKTRPLTQSEKYVVLAFRTEALNSDHFFSF